MLRPALWLALLALAALPLAACGSDTEATAAQGSTAEALLRETFRTPVESGRLDLNARCDGATLTVRGPFADTRGTPRFDLDVSASGHGHSLDGGATSTGDRAFVTYEGTDYEVPAQIVALLRAKLEQGRGVLLGLDPARWIRHPEIAGERGTGADRVIRITGDVDVPRLLADLDRLRARLGGGSGGAPSARERRELAAKVRDARVEVATGAEDRRLRGLLVTGRVRGKGAVRLELTLTEVGEEQTIEAPPDPRPFAELVERFPGLPGVPTP